MYFQDFEIYQYKIPFKLPDVTTLGWLDSKHDYTKGEVSSGVVKTLWQCIDQRTDKFDLHVNRVRGIHSCNFCGEEVRHHVNPARFLGTSEIWIPHDSGWFAAPSLIVHYIADHKYEPPSQYIDALQKLDFNMEINSQKSFEEIVRPIMLQRDT